MKAKNVLPAIALCAATAIPATAQEALTGDTRLACEALLCLATGTRPSECTPSLTRYFSISFKKWSDTLRGRTDFLNLCPAVAMDSKMSTLVNDIGNGAGRCDAASMNAAGMSWTGDSGPSYISNAMPSYCTSYTANAYTDLKTAAASYVGVPERGGYWVDAANYEKALADYNTRIAAEDAARQSTGF